MIGMKIEEVVADVKNTLGEIANRVAGWRKARFAVENINLEPVIATSISGEVIQHIFPGLKQSSNNFEQS